MTQSSEYGEYYVIPESYAINENAPLSACYSLVLHSNARHLRDEMTQYRVNWAGYQTRYKAQTTSVRRTDQIYFSGTVATYQHCITNIFPWTISNDVGPVAPVVYMNGYADTSGSTFYVSAYITPYNHEIGNYRSDEGLYQVGKAWRFLGDTGTETIGEIIAESGASKHGDPIMSGDALLNGSYNFKTWELDADDATQEYNHYCYLFRISVYCKGDGAINSLMVREFNK